MGEGGVVSNSKFFYGSCFGNFSMINDEGDDDVRSVGVEGDSWKLIRRLDYYLLPRVHSYLKG